MDNKTLHMKLLLGSSGLFGWEIQRSLAPLSGIFACYHNTVDFDDLDSLQNAEII